MSEFNQASADARAETQETHERWERTLTEHENAAPAAPVEPNAADLHWLDQMQGHKNADGQRLYETDVKFRNRLEAARMQVFAGESIADVRTATERALRGEPEERPATSEPVEPVGTPAERINARLDAGEVLSVDDVPEEIFSELSAGYNIADLLPEDFGIGAMESEYLHAARAAGLSEDRVRQIARQIIKAQGG